MRSLLFCLVTIALAGCQQAVPRRPVEVRTGTVVKQAAERNKKLLAQEEKEIMAIIKKDSLHFYRSSGSGSWYYYVTKNDTLGYTPRPDDLVTMNYSIMNLHGDTIYPAREIGTVRYKVDKQALFPGLRHSVKLLQENETATFLYPSSMGYGVHGDDHKIGINVPLRATLSILKIEKHQDSIQP